MINKLYTFYFGGRKVYGLKLMGLRILFRRSLLTDSTTESKFEETAYTLSEIWKQTSLVLSYFSFARGHYLT